MAKNSHLKTYESQIKYAHFARMVHATAHQREYRVTAGAVFWHLAYLCRWPLYMLWARKICPRLFTIECGQTVIGGIMLGPSGELGQPVVTRDPRYRTAVLRLLSDWITERQEEFRGVLYFRTFEDNYSLIRAAIRRGFCLTEERKYVVTTRLGILTFSWVSNTVPKTKLPLLEVRTLRRLEYRRPN